MKGEIESKLVPGSMLPLPLSSKGCFPGDAIVEVNGQRVKYAPVEKVVEAITRVPYHPPLLQRKSLHYCMCNNTVMHK